MSIALSIQQYNSPVCADDVEMLEYLTQHLTNDWHELRDKLYACKSRHGSVPQALVDTIAQLGEDLLDELRDVDEAYQDECARRERDDAYGLLTRYGREPADYC